MAATHRRILTVRIDLRTLALSAILGCGLAGLIGCQGGGSGGSAESTAEPDDDGPDPARANLEAVVIDGRTFYLERATTDATRIRGLGGRESLPDDGGMIFVFPDAAVRNFVMRDCVMDIDIMFLDAKGRITAMHHMPMEDPLGPDESATLYEYRLRRYSSNFRAQFAIELQGGMLEQLDIKVQQKIDLDLDRLKAMAE